MANKRNYNREMKDVLASLGKQNNTLLLHACCAPCASTCMERVRDSIDTTVFFYNPNITNEVEYNKRADELTRLVDAYNCMANHGRIDIAMGEYDPREFTAVAKGYEDCPERGERCLRCYDLRLRKSIEYAILHEYDYVTTTLTLSPLKDTDALNSIGERISIELREKYGTDKGIWLPSDFKKEGGYARSIELSKEYNLYRQNYCGCVYSKRDMSSEQRIMQ